MGKTFSYIWKYTVKKDHQSEFKEIYGVDGAWVQLFKKASGYIKTDLHQDMEIPNKFITVDFWKSKEDNDRFLKDFKEAYTQLDKQCGHLTEQETFLGNYKNAYFS